MLLSFCTVLCGCQTTRITPLPGIDNLEMSKTLHDAIKQRNARSFEAVHRSLLTVRGRQFNLDGYVRMGGDDGDRLLVTAGMGNAIFDLHWPVSGEPAIKRSSGMLQDNVLWAGPGEDMIRTYLRMPSPSAHLTSPSEITFALEEPLGDHFFHRYIFDKSTFDLLAYELARKGRVRYRITYRDYSNAVQEGHSIAQRIEIENFMWKYTVDIRVISMKIHKSKLNSEL